MSKPSTDFTKLLYSVSFGLGVTLLSGLCFWICKIWKQDAMPRKWRRVGTLAQINIFPIKSCARLKLDPLNEVACESLGLGTMGCRDRSLMLIDDKNQMVTARTYPKLLLIEPKIENSSLLLVSAPDMETTLVLNLVEISENNIAENILTSIWGTTICGKLCGEEYDRWFSKFILDQETGLRLLFYSHLKPVRSINARLAKEPFIRNEDTGAFGDATSYMLMNLSSVADLNTRLSQPVDPIQFRGNFHLKMDTDVPYAEDNWRWIKIGNESIFRNVSLCTRCILPNIDPSSGIRNSYNEPLRTLQKYRRYAKYGSSPVLGIHLGLRQSGCIKVNDIVYVEDDTV